MSKPSPQFFDDESYKLMNIFMKITGLWPYQTHARNCFCVVFILLLFNIMLTAQVNKLMKVLDDLDEILECLPMLSIIAYCLVAVFSLTYNSKKLKICMERIVQDWQSLNSDTEIKILQTYRDNGRKLTRIYFVYTLSVCVPYILQPFMIIWMSDQQPNRTLDLSTTLPFPADYSLDLETYIYLILFHCYMTMAAVVGILCSMHMTYIIFIQHACGLFSVVGYNLEHIGKEDVSTKKLYMDKAEDKNYFVILGCLRKHIKATEFCELVENAYALSLLLTMGITMLSLTLTGVQTVMHLDDVSTALRHGTMCAGVVIQLSWECFLAQFILDYSVVPHESAMKMCWYNTSPRCRKLLTLIMVRATKPSKISAGKVCTLSVETYSAVIRMSMSYFTVLQSMK